MAESHANARRERPLSPHLSVFRLTITMVMSIVHRITGAGLYCGMPFLAWWLVAAASGPDAFATANAFFGSFLGQFILLGFTWALIHHMLGGIRHLVWDAGYGFERQVANRAAWASLVGSVSLTLIVWVVGYMLR